MLVPNNILEVQENKLRSIIIKEYLVQWEELPREEATWEGQNILQHPSLKLLGDREYWEGGTIMSPHE